GLLDVAAVRRLYGLIMVRHVSRPVMKIMARTRAVGGRRWVVPAAWLVPAVRARRFVPRLGRRLIRGRFTRPGGRRCQAFLRVVGEHVDGIAGGGVTVLGGQEIPGGAVQRLDR